MKTTDRTKGTETTAPAPAKNFTIKYVYRSGGRNFTGQTVGEGTSAKAALSSFTKENPHVISAHVV